MKKIINILLLGSLALSFTACEKYLDKLDNPNLVTDPPINGLMAKVTLETGLNSYRMGDVVSYYTQYLASNTQGSDADIYNEVDYSGTWTNFYNCMMNIKQMSDLAAEKGATYHIGIGKILMAYNLNMLINSFGDVPYTEALQGPELLIPTFDSQEALHDSTLQLLDEGIAELNKTGATLNVDPQSDVIHNGDIGAWIKTANALKARFLNQLSKTASYSATNVLNALNNAYDNNGDDATLTAFNGRSPWNQVAYNNTVLLLNGWLSTQVVDAMNGTTYGLFDPRLPLVATITKYGDYRGTPNGAGRIGTGTDDEESYLSVDGFYSKGNAPVQLVTYAELKFIEAEAAFRNNDKARAYQAYIDGIKANMAKVGVAAGDESTYVNNPSVSVGEANISLDLIFKEKYVATFLNPETWVDARRYDYKYKDFGLPLNAALPTFIRRLAYPSKEVSRNGPNVPPVTGLDERLFWDE